MASLEGSLAAFESKIAEAEKSAVGLTKALRYLKKAASSGQLSDLEKGLAAVMQRAEQARQTASLLPGAWGFDASGGAGVGTTAGGGFRVGDGVGLTTGAGAGEGAGLGATAIRITYPWRASALSVS